MRLLIILFLFSSTAYGHEDSKKVMELEKRVEKLEIELETQKIANKMTSLRSNKLIGCMIGASNSHPRMGSKKLKEYLAACDRISRETKK